MNDNFAIDVAGDQDLVAVDESRFRRAVEMILTEAGIEQAEIEIAVVDDETIRPINARFLGHDYATDVISFPLQRTDTTLEGQVVLSAETAVRNAAEYGWSPEDEMLLYLVHGTLHLIGFEDATRESRQEMRAQERSVLAGFGLTPPWKDDERVET